jgi:hypothetical protein
MTSKPSGEGYKQTLSRFVNPPRCITVRRLAAQSLQRPFAIMFVLDTLTLVAAIGELEPHRHLKQSCGALELRCGPAFLPGEETWCLKWC